MAWVSLDRFDDDPVTLLASLASAYFRADLGSADLVSGMRGHGVSVLGRAAPRLAAEFRAARSHSSSCWMIFMTCSHRPATMC